MGCSLGGAHGVLSIDRKASKLRSLVSNGVVHHANSGRKHVRSVTDIGGTVRSTKGADGTNLTPGRRALGDCTDLAEAQLTKRPHDIE